MFGIAIQRIDGVEVTGPNTREAGLVPDRVEGTGIVDLRVDRLMLVPGTYDLSVSLVRLHVSRTRTTSATAVLRFDVEAGDPYAEFGILALDATWSGTPSDATLTHR